MEIHSTLGRSPLEDEPALDLLACAMSMLESMLISKSMIALAGMMGCRLFPDRGRHAQGLAEGQQP